MIVLIHQGKLPGVFSYLWTDPGQVYSSGSSLYAKLSQPVVSCQLTQRKAPKLELIPNLCMNVEKYSRVISCLSFVVE